MGTSHPVLLGIFYPALAHNSNCFAGLWLHGYEIDFDLKGTLGLACRNGDGC